MTNQIILRFALVCSILFATSYTCKPAMAMVPVLKNMQQANADGIKHMKAHLALYRNIISAAKMYKEDFFKFAMEETVHIYNFCFDKIRRRRRFINYLVCACTKVFLIALHLTILACHLDHILNHGLHHLLDHFISG